jgi:hypothetical protein
MKLTKLTLQQIIKEELDRVIDEGFLDGTVTLPFGLGDRTPEEIIDYVIKTDKVEHAIVDFWGHQLGVSPKLIDNIKNVSQLSPQKQKEVNHFLVRELKDQLTKFADKAPPYQLLKQFADKVIYAQKALKQKPSSSKSQQSTKKWKPYQGRPGDLGSI